MDQINTPPRPEVAKGKMLLAVGIVILVGALLAALSYFKILTLPSRTLPTNQPSQTTTLASPSPASPTTQSLESCQITKEGNPLVDKIQTLPDGTVVGTYRGNINKVTKESNIAASIEVISPRGDQNHTYNLKQEEGLIHILKTGQEGSLADLTAGNSVTISFDCAADTKQFRITNITITNKL